VSKSYLNLDVTYKFASDKIAAKDPVVMARNAGVSYNPETLTFKVKYLNQDYLVTYPGGAVALAEKDCEVPIAVKILILHYLATANGAPLQNKWISFKELTDGAIYIEPFTNRAINPMLKMFAHRQRELIESAQNYGGRVENLGDTSVTINVFPNVPITFVIYSADDEFPASGNILFDRSASCYLPTEDYALMSSLVMYRLSEHLPSRRQ
jgi:hypothetical protein